MFNHFTNSLYCESNRCPLCISFQRFCKVAEDTSIQAEIFKKNNNKEYLYIKCYIFRATFSAKQSNSGVVPTHLFSLSSMQTQVFGVNLSFVLNYKTSRSRYSGGQPEGLSSGCCTSTAVNINWQKPCGWRVHIFRSQVSEMQVKHRNLFGFQYGNTQTPICLALIHTHTRLCTTIMKWIN